MRILTIIASIVLVLHSLIHLMGTASYMKLIVIQQLPYKTTVLGGRWDLGPRGTTVYGALWAVAAIGFIVAALALLGGWIWWQPVLLGVTLLSLVLTALDWGVAYAGVIVNIAILAILILGPRITSWFSR
jgi:hypothetical protein